jgi:hypothetical protein
MALTEPQIESVREIADEPSYSYVASLCDSLNASQELAMADDIDAWDTVKAKFVQIQGGQDGVYLNFNDDREAIRGRVRLRLGLSAYSSADIGSNSDDVFTINLRGGCWY